MAQRNPIGIYHKADEIVYYGRRRNGKDLPGTRWVAITARAQRALLDSTEDLKELRFTRGVVSRRPPTELATRRAAIQRANDEAWLRKDRQQALTEVLIDELNKLGASPPLDANAVEASYLTKLSAIRGN